MLTEGYWFFRAHCGYTTSLRCGSQPSTLSEVHHFRFSLPSGGAGALVPYALAAAGVGVGRLPVGSEELLVGVQAGGAARMEEHHVFAAAEAAFSHHADETR